MNVCVCAYACEKIHHICTQHTSYIYITRACLFEKRLWDDVYTKLNDFIKTCQIYGCSVGWDSRIHRLLLYRGVRFPCNECPDLTLNNLIVSFQLCWNFGECEITLYCHRSQSTLVRSGST